MSSDERDIFYFLKTWGKEFIGAKEICRRAATKRRYHDDPEWAKPLLQIMAERGVLEGDSLGRYRIKPVRKKGGGAGRWVSPEIEEMLKEKGVKVETNNATDLGTDEYYEQL